MKELKDLGFAFVTEKEAIKKVNKEYSIIVTFDEEIMVVSNHYKTEDANDYVKRFVVYSGKVPTDFKTLLSQINVDME